MSDYIKRSDLAAIISDLLVSPWAARRMSDVALGIREALCLVQDIVNDEVQNDALKLPAADVVEVVRCKDCGFWYVPKLEKGEKLGACGWWSGNAHIRATRAEDYCSRGVRKEGEG